MPIGDRSDPGSGSGPPRYPGTFLLAFREAIAGLNWDVRRWLGQAVECVDADGASQTVGLENLYRQVRREPRGRWPSFIADFLTKVRAAEKATPASADLGTVADRLLVRLGQPFTSLPERMKLWSQPLPGTGFGINLVVDQPDTMTYVTERMVLESGRPGSEWLAQAMANLRARTPADCFQPVHEDSGMLLCSVGDAYDSSRALLLDALLPDTAAYGCLVALPSRDELLVLPVGLKALPHMHLLRVLADKNFKSAPYPISEEVFWIHAGAWHPFVIDMRDREIVVRPPEAFIELFKQLTPEGEPDQDGQE